MFICLCIHVEMWLQDKHLDIGSAPLNWKPFFYRVLNWWNTVNVCCRCVSMAVTAAFFPTLNTFVVQKEK